LLVLLNSSNVVSDSKANNLIASTAALDWFFAGAMDNVFNFNAATETKTSI
jgi:hypothetical protein